MTNGDMCNCACYCFGVENVIHWYDGIFVLGDNDNELVTVTFTRGSPDVAIKVFLSRDMR